MEVPKLRLCLLLFLLVAVPTRADVIISEIVASNQDGLRDQDGDASDWLELYNDCDEEVALDGWFLTDNPSNLFKWALPDLTLGAGEHRVVFASGKDRRDPLGELHTNFGLRREGEFLALVDPFGELVSVFSPLYPPQRSELSYGVEQVWIAPGIVSTVNSFQYFDTPTPGTFNGSGLPGLVPEPTVSVPGGVYSSSIPVFVTSSPGSTVHYTLDGSDPDEFCLVAGTSLTIPLAPMEVRLKAFQSGL